MALTVRMSDPIRVLIADDSAFMRKKIKEILDSDPAITVVAAARNGEDAVSLTKRHQPDVVTLDINMPVLDGVSALQAIMNEAPRPVVMLSSLTHEGALATFECLELGAVDYIPKPSGTISNDIERISEEICSKVKHAARAGQAPRRIGPRRPVIGDRKPLAVDPPPAGIARQVVTIGISTGGPRTLMEVIPRLAADMEAAVAVVQHMPESFTGPFARRLAESSAIPFKEAEAGDALMAGHGYLARGGKHLVLARRPGGGALVRYSSHPADKPHMPSVDVLMESAVQVFGAAVVGVLMTGMGADGADGMVSIRRHGGVTIAEDESTCVVFGMPAQAIERGGADYVLPCYEIANKIISLTRRAARV